MSTVQRDLYLPSEWNLTGCTLVYRDPLHWPSKGSHKLSHPLWRIRKCTYRVSQYLHDRRCISRCWVRGRNRYDQVGSFFMVCFISKRPNAEIPKNGRTHWPSGTRDQGTSSMNWGSRGQSQSVRSNQACSLYQYSWKRSMP